MAECFTSNKQSNMKDVKTVVSTLLKNGAKRIDNAVVKTASVKQLDNYARVALTLNTEVKGMVKNADGDFVEGTTRVVFVSAYSIGAILSENEDTAFAKKRIMEDPDLLELILSYAKVKILQEHVSANEEYSNPFSDAEARTIEHDTWINHVYSIELGRRGIRAIEDMWDMMLKERMNRKKHRSTATNEEEEDE